MKPKITVINCPAYKFGPKLDLVKVSTCIDKEIIKLFKDKEIVVRGIQSAKHQLPMEELIENIQKFGSDRYNLTSKHARIVSDQPIDFYGYSCKAEGVMTLSVLEGFHKWKPMCLENPQHKVDIWLIYNADQLINVEYLHSYYQVKTKDGYVFRDQQNKADALLGILVIN